MARLTVQIVTPEKRLLSVEADEAIIPGARGLFGVRPGHTAFLSLVDPGPLTLTESAGNTQTFFVSGGFVEVMDDRVLVLADTAEPVTAIDPEAARRRLEEAQQRLKGLSEEDVRFQLESATVKRESARMALATRR